MSGVIKNDIKVKLGKTIFSKESELNQLNFKILEQTQRIVHLDNENKNLKQQNSLFESALANKEFEISKNMNLYEELYKQFMSLKIKIEDSSVEMELWIKKEKEMNEIIKQINEENCFLKNKLNLLNEDFKKITDELSRVEKLKNLVENRNIALNKILTDYEFKIKTLEKIIEKKDKYLRTFDKQNSVKLKNDFEIKEEKYCSNPQDYKRNNSVKIGICKTSSNIENLITGQKESVKNIKPVYFNNKALKNQQHDLNYTKTELDKKNQNIKKLESNQKDLFIRLRNTKFK